MRLLLGFGFARGAARTTKRKPNDERKIDARMVDGCEYGSC
jgi:hypothetical protein